MGEEATLTCPECGHEQDEEIPEDMCLPFYVCESCGETIRSGDECCVFCAHSDTRCPVSRSVDRA